ncbi:MAG: HAD hydrolase family protein [Gemmatimonadetes bacterium]|nr:HAD hydrolase family protein [Gemmatimonadota bacterium]MDA1103796.1 HAD hydrolase family protein [Gemmatimonadota bacterium]
MTRSSDPINPEIAARIKLVIFDVDGVLTDAGVYIGATGSGETAELKRFDIQDGVGMKMLVWGGLDVAIVSGRVSEATSVRARELGIVECHQEPDAHKLKVVEALLERKQIAWDEVAMIGDDIPDLAVMRRVGLKAAVGNATAPVVAIADWQATKLGGHGAAREFCDALLAARGVLDDVIERYVQERS